MKSNATSESRPRAPAFRFQGDGVASIDMVSIGALSDFFDTSAQSMDESASGGLCCKSRKSNGPGKFRES